MLKCCASQPLGMEGYWFSRLNRKMYGFISPAAEVEVLPHPTAIVQLSPEAEVYQPPKAFTKEKLSAEAGVD